MPMFSSDVLPDVTGRALGSADKQFDIFARNITISGSQTGGGQDLSNIQNAVLDKDTLNLQSDNGSGMLVRIRLTNPGSGIPQFSHKNQSVIFGGILAADSKAVPITLLSAVVDGLALPLLTVMRQGGNAVPQFVLDAAGRITWSGDGSAYSVFTIIKTGDTGARWFIDNVGAMSWGAGGTSATDTQLARTAQGQLTLSSTMGNTLMQATQFQSMAAAGTAPFIVASNTVVPNLNADLLDGADWASPPSIGSTAPNTLTGTTVTATGQIRSQINDGVTPPMTVVSTVPVDIMRVRFLSSGTIETSINGDGSGLKHKRLTTGSIAAGATVNVVVNFTTPFPDANYTPFYAVFDAFNSGGSGPGLRCLRHTGQNANGITVLVTNDDGTNAHTGTLRVLALHD